MRISLRWAGVVVVSAAVGMVLFNGLAAPGATTRLSVSNSGTQASGDSLGPSVSWTGGAAAFSSDAPDLVAGDTNGAWDVFRRDLLTPTPVTERVDLMGTSGQASEGAYSVAAAAARFSGTGWQPEGRYVAFVSRSADLGPTGGFSQIFVRDRQSNATTLVSVDGSQDGIPGNGDSFSPSISSDGRFVAFASQATNLGNGDTNAATDIFVRDWLGTSPTTIAVSSPSGAVADGDNFAPAISPDGRYVAFQSNATNLVAGDTNGFSDVFVRDLQTAATRLISRGDGGALANGSSGPPAISDGGSYVAFASAASNLLPAGQDTNGATDVFVATNADPPVTNLISVSSSSERGEQSNGDSLAPAISADARYVAFQSAASNLVSDDTNNAWDVFVRDRVESLTYRASIDTGGNQANGPSTRPVLSADGRYVGFESSATALISGDTNGAWDIFRQDTDADGDGYSDALEISLGENASVYCAIMRADVNGDHVVGTLDFGAVAGKFGQAVPPANPRLDQNGDNKINMLDLGAMAGVNGQNVSACPSEG